jgi:hypothetical protein
MNLITGRHLPRRTFLRGLGGSVALPFLNAMVPAGGSWRQVVKANALDRTRLIAIESVHGAAGCSEWGATQNLWSPAATGTAFDLAPTALSSLEPYRSRLTIVSNTDCRMAEAFDSPEIGGDHYRSSAVFLTQAHPKQTRGSDVYVGTSLDQVYAQRFGQDQPIPSVQLCIEPVDQAGGCSYGYTCVYTDSISWAGPADPLPLVRDPRVAFEMLFGAGGSAEQRATLRKTNRSILDWIVGEVGRIRTTLEAPDRVRLEQYLENIREVERRIQRIEARNASGEPRELPGAPAGVPDSFDEHVRLMFDLQVLAFESDMTRVFSFKTGRDASARVYPESGSDRPFHPASHHGGRPEGIIEFFKINRYHVQQLTYLLDKLAATMEAESSLLDKTMIVYGSPMADGNLHNHRRCPLIVLGGANGQLKGGVHLEAPDGTPMANVMLTLLHRLGLDDLASFGDSTGEFGFPNATTE